MSLEARNANQTRVGRNNTLLAGGAAQAVATDLFFGDGDHITSAGGIASAAAVGTPSLLSHISSAGAIGTAEGLGTPRLVFNQFISGAGGIASAAAVPSPVLADHPVVFPSGIASGEAFGTPRLQSYVNSAGSIATGAAVGTPSLSAHAYIAPSAIGSGEAFGTPHVVQPPTFLYASTIVTQERFGTPSLVASGTSHISAAGGIASAGGVGTTTGTTSPGAGPVVNPVVSPRLGPGVGNPGSPGVPSSGPGSSGYVAPVPRVAEYFYDPVTNTTYQWAVNHWTETATGPDRNESLGAYLSGGGLARQYSGGGDLTLHLEGTLLTAAQKDEFDTFWTTSGQNIIQFGDFAGDIYNVVMTTKNVRRVRAAFNKYDNTYFIYRFVLELQVVSHVSSSVARAGIA